jgi:DivIVA domain-containing protein
VALDRQSIEKKDFPIGRRGYEPEAVDDHLNRLADEVEALKSSTRKRTDSMAASASEQVRSIVDAAETTAAQIQADAEREAKQIRADTRKELRTVREQATSEAAEYVSKISQSAASMLERIDAMEQELGTIVESLRSGASRLGADLRLLETNLEEVKGAASVAVAGAGPSAPPTEEQDESQVEGESPRAAEPEEPAPAVAEELEAVVVVEEDEAVVIVEEAEIAEAEQDGEDLEGARLIALNMALNGNAREDIDRYLAENFDLADRDALLDEVYASVEG